MTQPPQNNNPYPVPGPNGEPVQPAPAANGYQAPAANGYQAAAANGYQAPNVNGMPSYPGQQGFMPAQAVAPDAEEKFKRSQIVLLATAGAYLLFQILSYVLSPKTIEVLGETVPVESNPAEGFLGVALGLALFGLVFFLMHLRKKAGRIVGYVFAGLGILSACIATIGALFISPFVAVLSVLWLALGITWIIFVSNKSVSSILR